VATGAAGPSLASKTRHESPPGGEPAAMNITIGRGQRRSQRHGPVGAVRPRYAPVCAQSYTNVRSVRQTAKPQPCRVIVGSCARTAKGLPSRDGSPGPASPLRGRRLLSRGQGRCGCLSSTQRRHGPVSLAARRDAFQESQSGIGQPTGLCAIPSSISRPDARRAFDRGAPDDRAHPAPPGALGPAPAQPGPARRRRLAGQRPDPSDLRASARHRLIDFEP
jgi:hypothetical protein